MNTFTLTCALLAALNVSFSDDVSEPDPLPEFTEKLYIDPFADEAEAPCSTVDVPISLDKNGLIADRWKWKNFNVQFDKAYSKLGMYYIQQEIPCIKFGIWPQDAKPSGDYVYVIKGKGCSAIPGRQGGRQVMNLQSPGCMKIGTIMHEMIHALGFHHEQSRPDRDNHVRILWQNIEEAYKYNFDKMPSHPWTTFNVPYNQRSIMNYGSYYYSINNLPTILAKDGGKVGSTGEMTREDKLKLKKMHGC